VPFEEGGKPEIENNNKNTIYHIFKKKQQQLTNLEHTQPCKNINPFVK